MIPEIPSHFLPLSVQVYMTLIDILLIVTVIFNQYITHQTPPPAAKEKEKEKQLGMVRHGKQIHKSKTQKIAKLEKKQSSLALLHLRALDDIPTLGNLGSPRLDTIRCLKLFEKIDQLNVTFLDGYILGDFAFFILYLMVRTML